MDRILIVNADDFGLSRGQNYGIVEACRHGLVTSTTALVNGEAIIHAAELSRTLPELAVGMHFALTLGEPLTRMPKLARNGRLGKWIWQMAEEGALPLDEIGDELSAQYQRFIDLFGAAPSHIDSHHHVHMIPPIFAIVAAFAKEKGLPVRIDRALQQRDGLDTAGLRSSDGFSSAFYGDAIGEALFLEVLETSIVAGERSLEVMCHPSFVDNTIMGSAYCYPRLAELEVLTSPSLQQEVARRGFRPGSYRDL